ncbi:hypothetical protein NPIL_433291, partial [Nephila pilipes]
PGFNEFRVFHGLGVIIGYRMWFLLLHFPLGSTWTNGGYIQNKWAHLWSFQNLGWVKIHWFPQEVIPLVVHPNPGVGNNPQKSGRQEVTCPITYPKTEVDLYS